MATSPPEVTDDGTFTPLTAETVQPTLVERTEPVIVETPLTRAGDVPIGTVLEQVVGGAVAVVGARGPAGEPGPTGPPGPSGNPAVTVEALVNLNAYTVVKVMGNGKARPASSLIAGDGEATTGVTTAAALAGEQVPIRTVGAVMVDGGNLTVGPLYLGHDGALTPDHSTGLFQLRIGYAQTPTLLVVRIDPPIYVL